MRLPLSLFIATSYILFQEKHTTFSSNAYITESFEVSDWVVQLGAVECNISSGTKSSR